MNFNKIKQTELEAISHYLNWYAGVPERKIDVPKVLQHWDAAKITFLSQVFGDSLIASKHIEVAKEKDVLVSEMEDAVGRSWIPAGRFLSNFKQFAATQENEFSPAIKNALYDMRLYENLVNNRYNGVALEIPVPNGGKPIKLAQGSKIVKILSKLAVAYKIDGFEEFRIAHSQVLNQRMLTGELCLSIHPLDYMTMSDNDCGWDSCMSWVHDGEYRAGTVEMMNSNSVIVAYLKSESDFNLGEGHIWNNKKWRQLFVVTEDIITGIHGYPYANQALTKLCLDMLKDMVETNTVHKYTEKTYNAQLGYERKTFVSEICEEPFYFSFGTHHMYNDFGSETESYIGLKADEYVDICFSGVMSCMQCGDVCDDGDAATVLCGSCDGRVQCDCCSDKRYSEDMVAIGNGEFVCEYCFDEYYVECPVCGEYTHVDSGHTVHLVLNEENIHGTEPSINIHYGCKDMAAITKSGIGVKTATINKWGWDTEFMYICLDDCPESLLEAFNLSNEDDIKWFKEEYSRPEEN